MANTPVPEPDKLHSVMTERVRPRALHVEKNRKVSRDLELCAGVRVNLAIQTNFFKNRRCPLHNFPQFGCILSLKVQVYPFNPSKINGPRRNFAPAHPVAVSYTHL